MIWRKLGTRCQHRIGLSVFQSTGNFPVSPIPLSIHGLGRGAPPDRTLVTFSKPRRDPAHNMSSPSPPSSARFATGLRPAPAGVHYYPIGSAAYFSAVSLRGLLSHPSASRVSSVSFRQRPSPLAVRSRLPSAARSSGDPGPGEVISSAFTRF